MNGIEDIEDIGVLCSGLFIYGFNEVRSECLYLCEIPCWV